MGAWDYGPLRYGMDGSDDERLAAAIIAVKEELLYTGTNRAIVASSPKFGDATRNAVKDYQARPEVAARLIGRGFTPGEVDRYTARELFRPRVRHEAQRAKVEVPYLGKKLQLESWFDPVAVGTNDPDDRGISQINKRAHPDVSDEETFQPSFAIPWAADYLASLISRVINDLRVVDAARAGYNVGLACAERWLLAGLPNTGEECFVTAARYLSLVDKQEGWD